MVLQFLQDPSKTQHFQQGILRLVGDELVSEFQLTRADRPPSAVSQVLIMLPNCGVTSYVSARHTL